MAGKAGRVSASRPDGANSSRSTAIEIAKPQNQHGAAILFPSLEASLPASSEFFIGRPPRYVTGLTDRLPTQSEERRLARIGLRITMLPPPFLPPPISWIESDRIGSQELMDGSVRFLFNSPFFPV